jgi:hypothetical protein
MEKAREAVSSYLIDIGEYDIAKVINRMLCDDKVGERIRQLAHIMAEARQVMSNPNNESKSKGLGKINRARQRLKKAQQQMTSIEAVIYKEFEELLKKSSQPETD